MDSSKILKAALVGAAVLAIGEGHGMMGACGVADRGQQSAVVAVRLRQAAPIPANAELDALQGRQGERVYLDLLAKLPGLALPAVVADAPALTPEQKLNFFKSAVARVVDMLGREHVDRLKNTDKGRGYIAIPLGMDQEKWNFAMGNLGAAAVRDDFLLFVRSNEALRTAFDSAVEAVQIGVDGVDGVVEVRNEANVVVQEAVAPVPEVTIVNTLATVMYQEGKIEEFLTHASESLRERFSELRSDAIEKASAALAGAGGPAQVNLTLASDRATSALTAALGHRVMDVLPTEDAKRPGLTALTGSLEALLSNETVASKLAASLEIQGRNNWRDNLKGKAQAFLNSALRPAAAAESVKALTAALMNDTFSVDSDYVRELGGSPILSPMAIARLSVAVQEETAQGTATTKGATTKSGDSERVLTLEERIEKYLKVHPERKKRVEELHAISKDTTDKVRADRAKGALERMTSTIHLYQQ